MLKHLFSLGFFLSLIQFNTVYCQFDIDSLHILLEQSDYWQNEKQHHLRRLKRQEVNEAILDLDCAEALLTDSIRAMVFYRLANNYDKLGNGSQALYYGQGSLEYARKYYGLMNSKNLIFLNKVAQTLEFHFDNIEAVLQIRKEIERIGTNSNLRKLPFKEKKKIFENLIFIANTYLKIEDKLKFDSTYTRIDQLVKIKELEAAFNPFEYALFKSYGYLEFNRLKDAYQIIHLEMIKQDSLFRLNALNPIELMLTQTVLAEVYLAQNKPKQSLVLYRNSINIQEQYVKDGLMYEAYIIYIGAKALTELKQYEESKNILSEVILKLENLGNKSSSTHLAELYEQLAKNQFLASIAFSNSRLLYESHGYNQQALKYLETAWQQLKNQSDLRYSLKSYYQVFESSLQTLHALYAQTDSLHYFEEALHLVELTKNVQLRSSIKQGAIAEELGISIHLLERERSFKEQLFDLEYEIKYTAENNLRHHLQDSMHQVNAQLLALQDAIHRDYPNYTGRVQTQEGFKWSALHQHLQKEDQTLLYFASGEEHLFLLGASSNGYVFYKAEVSQDSLQVWINVLRENTYTTPNSTQAEQMNQLTKLSARLYNILLRPIDSIATSRLLIVPDGPLEVLPFAMLLNGNIKKNTPINEWPFALNQYSFSYAYALDLLLRPVIQKPIAFKEKILAFAPDFPTALLRGDNTRYQGQLVNNKEEVNYIKGRFSTTAFLGDQARLSTFRETVSDYAVLHLATHAVANTELGDYSYLAFSEIDPYDNQLNVGELYTMNIPAELVVLSACETGLGEWQRGEGVIGLERAFSYAGAQSLVTTHWKVSDRASASLMGYFYDELAKGLPKDQALQKAQLAFIEEQDSWLAHPFFWAAYVQKGDTSPLSIPKKTSKWIWWLVGIGTIGGIFVFSKKTR